MTQSWYATRFRSRILTSIQLIGTVRARLRRRAGENFLAQGADFAYPGVSGDDVTIWP